MRGRHPAGADREPAPRGAAGDPRPGAAGLDGIVRGAEPPPIVTGDPYAAEGTLLPQSLGEAVEALAVSGVYRAAFGDALIDYLVMMKRFEVEIHAQAEDRSAWEMAEYFEIF